jgi:prevent-host-death family protein
MSAMSATNASRGFSEVLDRVEHGETVRITRGGRPVAEIRPVVAATGRALREALVAAPGLDEAFASDIAAATDLLRLPEDDPWRDA